VTLQDRDNESDILDDYMWETLAAGNSSSFRLRPLNSPSKLLCLSGSSLALLAVPSDLTNVRVSPPPFRFHIPPNPLSFLTPPPFFASARSSRTFSTA
jgi:hypothetical protein